MPPGSGPRRWPLAATPSSVGSSLVVYPAARLPELAGGSGATLLILDREPTPLDPLADLLLRGECGELLPALVDAVVAGG